MCGSVCCAYGPTFFPREVDVFDVKDLLVFPQTPYTSECFLFELYVVW